MEMLCSRCDYDASNDVLNLREDSWQCPDCKRWNLTRADRPEKQVGGNHYNMPIEPIEFTEANELTFHEGNAIKWALASLCIVFIHPTNVIYWVMFINILLWIIYANKDDKSAKE
jgi:hypothetical protein